MSDNWKKVENQTNKELGAKSEGHYRRGKDCPDGVTPLFSYEYTNDKRQFKTAYKEMQDAETHCRGGRIPVWIDFPSGKDRTKGLVTLYYEDWRALHGK